MALTLKQVGTGKTWTAKEAEEKNEGEGAAKAAPAQWSAGGLTLKRMEVKTPEVKVPVASGGVTSPMKGGVVVPVSAEGPQADAGALPYAEELKRLEARKQELTVGLDLDGAAEVQQQINKLKSENGTSLWQRVGNTLSGAGKQMGAAYSDAAAAMYEAGQKQRDNQNDFFQKEYQRQYDDAERDYRFMLEDNEAEPGTWSQSDIETALNRMSAAKTKLDAMGVVVNEKAQERATTAARDFNLELSESGVKDTEKAKEGLGGAGRLAVDAATGLAQLGGDIVAGMATGGGATVPLVLRSFGGGTMKARQEGASLKQQMAYGGLTALTELLTEKIGSVGRIQTKAFGKGGLDDIFEGVVAAAERAGKTPAGRAALNRLASAGTGFVSEGLEEAISALVEPAIAKLTYGKELPGLKELAQDVAYDFLVGGAIGAVTGGVGGTDTTKVNDTANRNSAQGGEKENAASEVETAATVKSGQSAINERSQERRTLAYTLATNLDTVRDMEPVSRLTGREMNERSKSIPEQISDFFKSLGNVDSEGNYVRIEESPSGNSKNGVTEGAGQASGVGVTAGPEGLSMEGNPPGKTPNPLPSVNTTISHPAKSVNSAPEVQGYPERYDSMADVQEGDYRPLLAAEETEAAETPQSPQRGDSSPYRGATGEGVQEDTDPADAIPDSEVALPIVPSNDPKVLKEWNRAAKIAHNFGCELRCAVPEGGGEGSYLNGVITINPDCENPVMQVLLHELTHRLESSQMYGRLTLFARRWLDANGVDVDEQIQEVILEREAQGHSLSERGAMQEVVAQFVQEHLFRDERSVQSLLREDRTLFQKIRNWLQDAVRWVKKMGGLFDDIYRAERLFEKALRSSDPKMGMSVAQMMSGPAENISVQNGQGRDTIGAEDQNVKEGDVYGNQNGEKAADTAGEQTSSTSGGFLREAAARGKTGRAFEARRGGIRKLVCIAYRTLSEGEVAPNARQLQRELKLMGIESFVHGGDLETWLDGSVQNEAGDCVSVNKEVVGIYNDVNIPARNAAGHEAYHCWSRDELAQRYHERVRAVVRYGSEEFRKLYDHINKSYFDGKYDLDNALQEKVFFEELVAYISGSLHNGEDLSGLLSDPEGVRAEWISLVESHAGSAPYALQTADAQESELERIVEREQETTYPDHYDSMADVQEGDYRPLPTAEEVEAGANPQSVAQTAPLAEEQEAEDPVEALPTKAREYLKGVERRLASRIGYALCVPKHVNREFLQPAVRYISEEFLATGKVSQEALDSLFDSAYDAGIVVEREYYDDYKFVRDYLFKTALTLSKEDQSDIADFNKFRKSAFGLIKLKNKGGLPVDVAYQELRGMAPELFPDSITHPADQLVRMYEVGQGIELVEKSLDDYYGKDAATFKEWAKRDFESAVADSLAELRAVERYAAEQTRKKAARLAASEEEVRKAYGEIRGARKTKEKAVAKHLLTDYDNAQVARLLKGEIEVDDLDPTKCNVRGVREVFEASKEYEGLSRVIGEYNRLRKAKLYEQADALLETANDWKDKGAGFLYSRETMERNIRDIVPDKDVARRVIDTYFVPVHEAQAQATRLKNRYRERVKGLNLSRKVAEGNEVSEAYAVQLVGEVMDNIRALQESRGRLKSRDGKSLKDWQGVMDELWKNSPNLDRAKIEDAVAEFRTIYDELFRQMNEVRFRNGYEPVAYRRGYFPHFQTTGEGGMLAAFGKALGIDTSVAALPTTINGLTHTFRPGITWFGNAQERLGVNTTYDAVEGFDKYIEGAADVIHHTDNLQRLRALVSRIRYKTSDKGIREQIDAVDSRMDLDGEQKRAIKDDIYKNAKFTLSRFVVELEEYTNLLANKKSIHDRNAEHDFGRKIYKVVKGVSGRVAANMVAVNPTSWMTNFIPITQAWGVVDSKDILRGMWETLRSYKEDDGLADRSAFLTNRRGSDPLVRTWSQEASAKLTKPMDWIDTFTSDVIVRARYRQNLRRGLSEAAALAEADAFAAGVIADRSKGATPTLFQRSNPTTKLLTQFQLEVNNQFSYLAKDIPDEMKEKAFGALAAALLKFFLGAFLYNEVYEFFVGRRPALDPLGILNDTVGDLSGWELPNLVELGAGAVQGDLPSFETEKKGVYQAGLALGENLAEEVPFVGGLLGGGRVPVSSAIPDVTKLWGAAANTNWAGKKRLETALKEIGKPLVYTLPPFGGGQLKKSVEGLGAVIQGGSYTTDSKGRAQLQYPVYNDTWSDKLFGGTQAAVFGKSANPNAREWVEDGFDTYGHKQTETFRRLKEAGLSDRKAHAILEAMRGTNGKKKADVMDIINGLDIDWVLKDALYLQEGYSEKTLDDAPWYMERWTLPTP